MGFPPNPLGLVHVYVRVVLGELVAHLFALGDLLGDTEVASDTQHGTSLLSRENLGDTEVHDLLGSNPVGGDVLGNLTSEVLVHLAGLAHRGLTGLAELSEHTIENGGVLVLGEVGDGELESGLTGDGGLGHGDRPF